LLLNKIPVLDKGYVALIDSCNTTAKLREMGQEFFGGEYPTSLEDLGSLTVAIKCPLFVQLNLSKFNLKVINAKSNDQPDVYLPTGPEFACKERTIGEDIAADVARTTASLLHNPKAYQADGAERFLSQICIPVNVYTTLIVQGSYKEWCDFINQPILPKPIAAYTQAIQQIITAEWK